MGQRRVVVRGIVLTLVVAACQATPSPSPNHPAASPAPSTAVAPSEATALPTQTDRPTPAPTIAEGDWDAVLDTVIPDLGAAIAGQYDGVERDVLERWFTPDGLASALQHDWQLRDVERGELLVEGIVALRAWTTVLESPSADPPRLDVELGFVVQPPSSLVDARTGVILERFGEPRYFGATYALRHEADADRWRVTAVAPHGGNIGVRPPLVGPPVRCPGLDPDAPSSHPVATIVWCFGGEDGTLVSVEQVASWEDVPCGGTSARVLSTGWPIGSVRDIGTEADFVQDPNGEFAAEWSLESDFDPDAAVPADAYSTGLTDGRVEIWVSPSAGDAAVWARIGDRFERWPKAGPWGVTDCN